MITVVGQIINWVKENRFNVEDQAGSRFIAISFEEMEGNFGRWLEEEQHQLRDAFEDGGNL